MLKKPKMAGTPQDGSQARLITHHAKTHMEMIVSPESGEKQASAWGRSALKGHKTRGSRITMIQVCQDELFDDGRGRVSKRNNRTKIFI